MTILLFTFLSLLLLHTPAWAEHKGTKLVERDGLFYHPFHDDPLSGKYSGWYKGGEKESEGTYKDDKQDGLWTWWRKNGQKSLEYTYKEGKKDGLFTKWDEQGNITKQGTYKNGEAVQ